MGSIKTIIELIGIFLDVLKYINGQYSDDKFKEKVSKRKDLHDKFKKSDRRGKLEALKKIN